jgi:hypothetical protein
LRLLRQRCRRLSSAFCRVTCSGPGCGTGSAGGSPDVAVRRAYRRCVRNVSARSTNRQQQPICRRLPRVATAGLQTCGSGSHPRRTASPTSTRPTSTGLEELLMGSRQLAEDDHLRLLQPPTPYAERTHKSEQTDQACGAQELRVGGPSLFLKRRTSWVDTRRTVCNGLFIRRAIYYDTVLII